MENCNQTPSIMGMPQEMYRKYNAEYMRLNPYNLPDIGRKRRRIVRYELVNIEHKNQ